MNMQRFNVTNKIKIRTATACSPLRTILAKPIYGHQRFLTRRMFNVLFIPHIVSNTCIVLFVWISLCDFNFGLKTRANLKSNTFQIKFIAKCIAHAKINQCKIHKFEACGVDFHIHFTSKIPNVITVQICLDQFKKNSKN